MPYVLLRAAASISSTNPDIEGDRRDGKRTTAVAIGGRSAHLLATLLLGGALLWSQVTGDTTAFIAGACSVPGYLLYIFVPKPWAVEASYKAGGAAVMIVAACRFPAFAPVALVTLLATILYFRLRFGIVYPSLMPAGPLKAKSVS